MCVAVLVETQKGPTAAELWQMEDSNPHGAGLAWAVNDELAYRKGLTWRQVADLLPRIPRPCLLHFRWATHGGQAKHLSHPFPVGQRALTSRRLRGRARRVLIHNGVWSDYLKFAPMGVDLSKWSDTAVAAYAVAEVGEEILDHVEWATALGTAAGGGRMDVSLRGRWIEHEGNLYSNLSWQPVRDWRNYAYGGSRWTGDGRLVKVPREIDPMSFADLLDTAGEPIDLIDISPEPLAVKKPWDGMCPEGIHGLYYEGQPCDLCTPEEKQLSLWLGEYEEAAKAKAGG